MEWSFYNAISIVIVVLIILVWVSTQVKQSSPTEKFDTFYNHDNAALQWRQDRYGESSAPWIDQLSKEALYDKYTWSEKDKLGFNIYDHVYDNMVADQYDNAGNLIGSATQYNEDILAMQNAMPYMDFRGQRVRLAQKTI